LCEGAYKVCEDKPGYIRNCVWESHALPGIKPRSHGPQPLTVPNYLSSTHSPINRNWYFFKFSLRRGWGILLPRLRSCLSGFWMSDISRQHSNLILKHPNVHQVSTLFDWSGILVRACTIIPMFGSHTHCHQNMQHGQDDVCSTKLPYTAPPTHPSRPTLTAKGYCSQTQAKRLLKKRIWLQVR